MKVAALLGDRAELTVPFPGGDLDLVYRPSVLLPGYTEREELSVTQALCDLVAEWPLEGREGAAVPLTPEGINAEVPEEMQTAIYVAILRDRRPNLLKTLTSTKSSGSSESA